MPYLNSLNVVFTGDFRSDVSTVNNDVRHYDNATFQKRFQLPRDGNLQNGWWNPTGGALFQFLNCTVRQCIQENGENDENNELIGAAITNSGDRSGGKMVDLDPQMQMTSELWGVRCKLSDKNGDLLFEGFIRHTGFRDLQMRQFGTDGKPNKDPNGQPLGATFYSVLEQVKWGNIDAHPFLQRLRTATDDNKLRIVLTTFGYYYNHADGRFSLGKILGSISPWKDSEPIKFTSDRRIYGSGGYFEYGNFAVNEEEEWLGIDLGMSIPIAHPDGSLLDDFTAFRLAVADEVKIDGVTNPVLPEQINTIARIKIKNPKTWLLETGGILTCKLKKKEIKLLKNNQLLLIQESGKVFNQIAKEPVNGLFMRADQNVQRIDPGDQVNVDFYVYQRGNPVPNVQVEVTLDPKVTGAGGGPANDPDPPTAKIPANNVPTGKVLLSQPNPTNGIGKTTITLTGTPPGNPRKYIDGQIYLFSYQLATVTKDQLNQYWNDKVIVHLRDEYQVPDHPKWRDVKPIWVQFGNLYPIMSHHIMDFSIRKDILAQKNILNFAFSREIEDPLYMPVTRDLSKNKMETLVKWMATAQPEEEDDDEIVPDSMLFAEIEEIEGAEELQRDEILHIMTLAKSGDPRAFEHPIFNQNEPE